MPRKKEVKVIKKEKILEDKNKVKEEEQPKKRNIITYFFGMIGIFILIQAAIDFTISDFSKIVLYYKYGSEIIQEIFYAVLVLIVMLLFKNSYVFTNRKEKLGKSLLYGFPLIVLSVYTFTVNVMNIETTDVQKLTGLLILCALIGITEEFLCRGWLQNEFLERFSDNKKSVIISIFLSSLIFGLMHITNVFTTSQNLFETLLQIINATSLGFLFGTIYYKTKNIWSVIILHSFYDLAFMIGEINQIKECTYSIPSNKIVFINVFSIVVLTLFWILSSILVLRKCNFPDSKGYATKSFYFTIIPLFVFTFFVSVIPYNNMVEDYDDYYVCYNYKELVNDNGYIVHYPTQKNYKVTSTNKTEAILLDTDSNELQEVLTINEYSFEISYNLNDELVLKNNNTGKKIVLTNGLVDQYAIFENNDNVVIIYSATNSKLEEEVYISDVMNKNELSNTEDYLKMIKSSFRKLELPSIEKLGYITFDGDKNKYPLFTSTDRDNLIYKDGETLLVK